MGLIGSGFEYLRTWALGGMEHHILCHALRLIWTTWIFSISVADGAMMVLRIITRWITTLARLLSSSYSYSTLNWQANLIQKEQRGIGNVPENLRRTLYTILIRKVGAGPIILR